MQSSHWAGVRSAYARYGSHAKRALERDITKALTWAATYADQFQELRHKNKHTGGDASYVKDRIRKKWLAHAELWIDTEFVGTRQRPALRAVAQALAYTSALAGELVEGVPVVAVGGRSLSHAAGLMSEDSVWAALRVLRDTPGSPVLLVARGAGQEADRYALTTPEVQGPSRARIQRARVEPVHPAWRVLGLRGRVVHELVSSGLANTIDDVLAGAHLRQSTGYAIVTDLIVAGLIERDGSTLRTGTRTLDQIAAAHGLDTVATERVVRHRAERVLWRLWLEKRFAPPPPDTAAGWRNELDEVDERVLGGVTSDLEPYLASVLAEGPCDRDPTGEALDLLHDQLGAVIVVV